MKMPPRTPTLLTMLGTAPFIIGAVGAHSNVILTLLPYFSVETVINYGIIILSFMTGILWGFAVKAPKSKSSFAYILSVLPALYVFFFVAGTNANKLDMLMLGFTVLLAIDLFFQRIALAPAWWMTLRIPVSMVVLFALLTTRINI